MKGRLKEMTEWCKQLMREEDLEEDEELEIGVGQDIPDIDAAQDIPNDTSTEVLIFFPHNYNGYFPRILGMLQIGERTYNMPDFVEPGSGFT